MDRLTIDSMTGARLAGLDHSVELYDISGNVLGWFQPAVSADVYEGIEPPFSAEELRHADEEAGGRPLEEILADLEGRQ